MVFDYIIKKYNPKIRGILHIGGHYGEEMEQYEKHGIKNVVFFEPLTKNFNILREKVGNRGILVKAALGSKVGKAMMFVESANNGQSASILEPNSHLKEYPNVIFNEREEVDVNTLDNFMQERKLDIDNYNIINIDVQGYELEVFKGSIETLGSIDYIMSEINVGDLYKDCAKVWELDAFLNDYHFERVETDLNGNSWGEAFYIKRGLVKKNPFKIFSKVLRLNK
ncbi:MAG: FkbM family methyltransferase [Bacteroidia bacterium]